jgi:hypothetical protein
VLRNGMGSSKPPIATISCRTCSCPCIGRWRPTIRSVSSFRG